MYKNELQKFAHARKLDLPVYSSDSEGPSHAQKFKSKVAIDGKTFESPEFFSTLKDAEQAAAKAALKSLLPDEKANVLHATNEQDQNSQESANLPVEPPTKAIGNLSIIEPSSSSERSAPPCSRGIRKKVKVIPTAFLHEHNIEGGTILPISDDQWTAVEFEVNGE